MIVIKILFGIFFLSLLVTGIAYLFNAPKSEWSTLSQSRPRKPRPRRRRHYGGLRWFGRRKRQSR